MNYSQNFQFEDLNFVIGKLIISNTIRRVIFEGSKFCGCSINFIFASQIFAGRGILATPTKWRLLVALRWMACRCGHAH